MALAILNPEACIAQPSKQLLGSNSISESAAKEMGGRVDVHGFRRIVAQRDPAVLHAFLQGMQHEGIHLLPVEIEEVAIANFDHPALGKAIRAIFQQYQTRKLFDLHASRIRAATDVRELSFEQIFNTHQTGIEDALAALGPRYPSGLGSPNKVALFLGERRHPAGVPLLVAELANAEAPPNLAVLQMLKQYPSIEVWKATRNALTSLHAAGRIGSGTYLAAVKDLEDRIALADGPKGTVAYWQKIERNDALIRQILRIQPRYEYIHDLNVRGLRDKKWDPKRFAVESVRYLETVEALAREMGVQPDNYEMSRKYFSLGMALRFQLQDPDAALRAFSKAASYRNWLGHIAVADTYQFALNDKQGAINAYQKAMSNPDVLPGENGAQAQWNNKWPTEEIRFLKTGKRFSGGLSEKDVAGFFETMSSRYSQVLYNEGGREALGELIDNNMRTAQTRKSWPEMTVSVASIKRASLSARLEALPASRLLLLTSLSYISCLPDAESMLNQLAKNDPSGIWSTPWLAAARAVSESDTLKEESLKNGIASLMPGLAVPGEAPIVTAAIRFMNERKLATPANSVNTQAIKSIH